MKIPMLDLYAQYRTIRKDVDSAVFNVIKTSAYVGGKYVGDLEKAIAVYCGVNYAVALNSGTDALYLSLVALNIKDGDEVITTPFSFFATAEVIARVGAKPVFVDIDPKTFNMNCDLVEKVITKRSKSIIPVHLFGLPCDMTKLTCISKKYKLDIIEDACQAMGATFKERKAGSMGKIGCFSFFPSKSLGAYGDGGMVVTDRKRLSEKIRILRNHGSKIKYFNESLGVSSRLDGIQAAILLKKLKYLDTWNEERSKLAEQYCIALKNIKQLEVPNIKLETGTKHIFHQYSIRVRDGSRNALRSYLGEKGISTMIYYPVPFHFLKAFKYLKYKRGDFPEAEKSAKQILSLPIYPEMKKSEVKYIISMVSGFYKEPKHK